jgi:PPK2 family polyphosphate:nucleotide phosphotransferase
MVELERFRLTHDNPVRLAETETGPGDLDMEDVGAQFRADIKLLPELHERLAAEEKAGLLIVLLAFDTGGKDETINGVFNTLPVQSLQIEKFNEPSEESRAHDFLWRAHIEAPRLGEIVVFNRSYYDDTTEPRLTGDLSMEQCRQRYKHILNFESLLREENATHILKFYLHISRDEQSKRIWERLDDPDRQWDFDPHDIETHERWDELLVAYEDVIHATTTEEAPWYVVPSDNEELRNAIVARAVAEALAEIDPQFPEPPEDIERWKRRMRELDRLAEWQSRSNA